MVLASCEPGEVPDAAALAEFARAELDGMHVTPGLAAGAEALRRLPIALDTAGLDGLRGAGGTLRQRLGLPEAVNQYGPS